MLGANAALLAEPLSLVQSLRNGVDGASFPGFHRDLTVSSDQAVVLNSGLTSLFGRDPESGRLTLLDTLANFDTNTEVPAGGDTTVTFSIDRLDSGLLVASGGVRHPSLCDGNTSCSGFGPFGLSTDTGEFVLEGFSGNLGDDSALSVSPDNKSLYSEEDGLTVYALSDSGVGTVVQVLGDDFRLDGSRSNTAGMANSPDSRFLFVHTSTAGSDSTSVITTFQRDESSGELTAVAEISAATEPGDLLRISNMAVSPDGETLFVSADARDRRSADIDKRSGLARYAIGDDGSLRQIAIDRTPNTGEGPRPFDFPGELTVSPNGRLVLVANTIGSDDVEESLHLFTVGDDGATTWRGFEQSNGDGLVDRDLENIQRVEFSPDSAFAYVLSGSGDDSLAGEERVVHAFAAHADNQTSIETPVNALADDSALASVRVFNAGPANAHGIVATIDASNTIISTDQSDNCAVSGTQAVCRFDELGAMGAADIQVAIATPSEGELSVMATTTQYQTDLDEASNTATATVPVVVDSDAVDNSTTTAGTDNSGDAQAGSNGDAAGGSSDSGSSGGGCSIASNSGPRDPLLALMLLAGLASGVRSLRRAEDVAQIPRRG